MVNISMISRAKFSFAAPFTLTPASRKVSIAGILRHGHHQVAEVARSLVLEQLQLVEQLAIVADLGFVDGEVAVPEQRHLFAQRLRTGQHPIRPPIRDAVGFERAGAQPVEKFVDHGLQPAVAVGLHFDAERFAVLLGLVGDGGAAGRKRLEARIVNARVIEGRQLAGVGSFEANQASDGLRGRQFCERLDFVRSSAEAGALQQVGGEIVIPIRGRDGLEIVLPGGGSGGLRNGRGRIDRDRHRGRDENSLDSSKHVQAPLVLKDDVPTNGDAMPGSRPLPRRLQHPENVAFRIFHIRQPSHPRNLHLVQRHTAAGALHFIDRCVDVVHADGANVCIYRLAILRRRSVPGRQAAINAGVRGAGLVLAGVDHPIAAH